MRPLAEGELLDVWERGLGLPPIERALVILAGAVEAPAEDLSRLTIGRRDAQLLRLRARMFGTKVEGLADCPSCGERLDIAFLTDDILAPEPSEPEVSLAIGGYEVT